MQAYAIHARTQGKNVGLVATMGALHEGHLSLIDIAREKSDVVVVSIFVNPTQFGPNEDFEKYPRNLEEDATLCKARGADVLFTPQREAVFSPGFSTFVQEEQVSKGLCGISRPGHFRGVCTVVNILFNVTLPDVAVFGQKDAQQCALIYKMVRDLLLPIEIVFAPTVRDEDGLALSSRNRYLDTEQRREATKIYQALQSAQALAREGAHSPERIRAKIMNQLNHQLRIRIIYVEVVDRYTMQPAKEVIRGQTLAAVAVWLDQVRLIDNIVL